MKIRVKNKKMRLILWLPNRIFVGRFCYSFIKHALKDYYEKSSKKEELPTEAEQNKQFEMTISRAKMKELYATLRRVIKKNGHFNVVDVQSAKGEKVLIRV